MTPLERDRARQAARDLRVANGLVAAVLRDRGLHPTLRSLIGGAYERSAAVEELVATAAFGGELKVVCAWCGAHLRGPREAPPDRVSHGICEGCAKAWRKR
ncbi:MAG: hypothetical protein KIT58_00045 [Planctomycetota bacterium]|nr:hypothetical protein [Planctomycetota bacterium]